MAVSVNSRNYILYILLNAKYLLSHLPSEVAHIYLSARSFDKIAKDWCIEFPKSIFWAGVELEFLFKWIISFAQEHGEKKWKINK